MEESQRFQEKKDISDVFPRSFSSPEWPVDHQIESDWELVRQIFPQRSPLFPEDRIVGRRCGKPHLDIISSLLALGCTSICEKICSYMKLQDLYRFSPSHLFNCSNLTFHLLCLKFSCMFQICTSELHLEKFCTAALPEI